MKKFIFVFSILSLMLFGLPSSAVEAVKVSALTPFNSLMYPETMKVMVLERSEVMPGLAFEDGTVIEGRIVEVKQPKRGKLNASFKFVPTSYSYNGKKTEINVEGLVAKYGEMKELDKAALATSAAAMAGKKFLRIPFISEGVSLIKGVVKNPEGNRLKSGVTQVYKDSPLSYIEEGKDLVINKDQMFLLKFKVPKQEDCNAPLPNNVTKVTPPSNNIESVNPEAVLKEVELNSK